MGGGEHEGEKSGVRVSRWAKDWDKCANKCEGAVARVRVTLKGEKLICAFQVR